MYIRISHGDDNVIRVARWLYSRIVEDINSLCKHAEHVTSALEYATIWQGLDVTELADDQKRDIVPAMKALVQNSLRETPDLALSWKNGLDDAGIELFRKAMRKLKVIFDRISP